MRRIRKANIKFISLVPKGANKLEPVYKADGTITFGTLLKESSNFDECGELTCVVYAPEHRDSQNDIADKAVIKEAAYDFIANGASVDINHDGKPVGRDKARVAENFLVQKSDPRFHGWVDADKKPVDLTDSWAAVIKIDDPELRKKYRSGEWSGVSMGGTAIVEQEKAGRFDEMLEKLAKFLNPPKPEPETMDETKILKAINDGFAELAKTLAPKAPETPKPPEVPVVKPPAEPVAPIYKGKLDDERQLQLHERELAMFELKKGTTWSDAASVRAYREQVSVLKTEWAEEDKAAGIEEKPVIKGKFGPSVASPSGGDPDGTLAALQMAEGINKSRGFTVASK